MIPALIVITIALGTLAFGAVYPWGFVPLYAAAAAFGLAGLLRRGLMREYRPLAITLLLMWSLIALQLLPLPRLAVDTLSPHITSILSSYSLTFAGAERLPLSINPPNTQTAALACAALAVYLIGLPSLLDRRTVRLLPPALAVFAVPLALFAMYTRSHNNGLIYGFWQPLDGGGSNQAGPFINRNHFGGWMVMTVCLLVGWLFGQIERALSEGGRRRRYVEWLSSAEANALLMTSATVVVAAISIFWSLSRSAIVAFGASLVAFAALAFGRQRLGTTRRTIGLVILGAMLLAGAAWRGPELFTRFQDETNLVGRIDAWRDSVQVMRDFPLMGTGLNTYSDAMLFYQRGNPGWHLAQAHNDYVQLLAEGGAAVAVPALIAIVLLARGIGRNLKRAAGEARGYWIRAGAAAGLCAMAVQEIFEFSLQIPANALLFCTLAAIALTPVGASSRMLARDTIGTAKESAGVPLS